MSDPYGNNGGHSYGQYPSGGDSGGDSGGGSYPPPPPGGGQPGGSYPGGYESGPPRTDGVSIAALVLSFLCCLAPIGVILGFIGLGRTKDGQRKGRGLAVAAIPIGIVVTIALGVGTYFVVDFAKSVVDLDDAKAGQCVDTTKSDGDTLLRKKDCDEKHDAEIIAVIKVTKENQSKVESGMVSVCTDEVDPEDLAKLSEYADDIEGVINDPDDIEVGDHLVCYVEPSGKLDKPLL